MNPFETWLAGATRGLSAESTAQVRAEINEHYQSACNAGVADGASCEDASFMAVAALGDAKSANRQYRRVLLTSGEARLLHLMTVYESPQSPQYVTRRRWVGSLFGTEIVVAAAVMTWKDHAWSYVFLALAGAVLAPLFLPIHTPLRSRMYRRAKWIAFIVAAALTGWYGVRTSPWTPLAGLLLPAYTEYVRTSIRRKLPVGQWPKNLYL